jgi:flagella basal body P-ring formation protein FlgA
MVVASRLFACSIASAETLLIPVPARTLVPGEQFSGSEFLQKSFEVSPIAKANYVTDSAQLESMEALRPLPAGRPIPLAFLAQKADVRKGRATVARFSTLGIEILGQLTPLRDAHAGEIVPCKNLASGLTTSAMALADGSLSVGTE